ncbi:outer membrane lipoprotein carrier protein LolA [Streptomyces sp. NPDC020917]|uniref:outer membrane lipoprotein carrier protein LolA n=1 Tax=Streptomyces sp. NPDC020917 TaxID=3365102 RepID=UPI0037977559
MAPIQPARYDDEDAPGGGGRARRAARYAVPVAVAGVAAATISLVPALADSGNPSLPSITAEQLLTKIAASDTQTVDGTVKVTTDLGLPSQLTGSAGGAMFGGEASKVQGRGGQSPAAPQSQLVQLLAGTHTLHVAADGQDKQKISIIESAAEYSIIHNGTQLWAYDSASNQAYHQTLQQHSGQGHEATTPQDIPATPQDAARQILKAADGTASITVDGTARVAGHSAYQLLVTPQHADTTTVGAIRIAVDAKTGVPLKVTLTPKGGGKAVFDVGYTRVSFSAPSASTFTFTAPKGVKVTEGSAQQKAKPENRDRSGTKGAEPTVLGQGWDSIAVVKSQGGPLAGGPAEKGFKGRHGDGGAGSLMNSFGTHVNGAFGSGTVFHTRLVNALLTDDGTLYVGAVTQSALTDAANAAAK